MKRVLDVAIAAILLAVLSPVLAAALVAVRVTSPGSPVHAARRTGQDGREFTMYKIRTMRAGPGPGITAANDPRITPVGRVLRRTHLDELPQLWNVIRGDMSLVGPRPEDPRFVALYSPEQREVLSVPPGITGPAQLAFRDEGSMLSPQDPEGSYASVILERKLRIDLEYVRSRSLLGDLRILARTLAALARRQADRSGSTSAR